MKNIVLVGMMGCGKTTCGKLLAEKLGRTFLDCDLVITEREGRNPTQIFAESGEQYFRDVETALCHELEEQEGLIIATGGGMVLRQENVDALRKNGVVFLLNRSVESIFDGEDLTDRPLAQKGRQDFIDRFEARRPFYFGAAHEVITDFSTPEATVGAILAKLKEYEND